MAAGLKSSLTFCIAMAASLAIGVLSAAAVPVVGYVDVDPLYSPHAVRAGGMRVEIYGAPRTDMDAAAIVAPLRAPAWVGGGPLEPVEPMGADGEGRRLILAFHGSLRAGDLPCRNPSKLGGRVADGPLRVVAVYCSGPKFMTRAVLSDGAIGGPDDPRYRRAMSSLFSAMFPPRNPETASGGGR